jgi:hypothetical protein
LILLDVNVVLAAHRADHSQHALIRPWFGALTQGDEQFTVPDVVWASFVRIATNRRVFADPSTLEEVFEFLDAVREQPNHLTVVPSEAHLAHFRTLCRETSATGDLAPDAYLAAIAMEFDAELISLDRDFARFPSLRWRLPG